MLVEVEPYGVLQKRHDGPVLPDGLMLEPVAEFLRDATREEPHLHLGGLRRHAAGRGAAAGSLTSVASGCGVSIEAPAGR